ncbi:universal stress protein [Kutzneria viridogrisea]|uniref:UspA domain-containing protein n=2 Tax=Kutzneria TaxID=43356 RepID=W5W8R1_9PSEU|nr:universal stress protein [Kutzneria albida]AHH97523.1 hypothetical protein KALB_4159 [Kutzneria albida DSM 43870]MBA8930539.1 nucleotide-binding universal stress UspA family protein [Kutzneria viridogrisea]
MRVRKIVVGVDGSQASFAALRWAVAEAERIDGAVEAVTAWQTDPPLLGSAYKSPDEAMAEQGERLSKAVEQVCGRTSRVPVREVLVDGWPQKALVAQARNADLLVVGRHGHGWLTEKLLGSVSTYCLRHASCPIVVIPSPVAPDQATPATEQETPLTPGPLL